MIVPRPELRTSAPTVVPVPMCSAALARYVMGSLVVVLVSATTSESTSLFVAVSYRKRWIFVWDQVSLAPMSFTPAPTSKGREIHSTPTPPPTPVPNGLLDVAAVPFNRRSGVLARTAPGQVVKPAGPVARPYVAPK